MWKYETEDRRWLWMPDPPDTVNAVEGAAAWTIDGEFFLFGGVSEMHGFSSAMWMFEPRPRKWSRIQSSTGTQPSARAFAATWSHKTTNTLYLYGGIASVNGTALDDLWAFNVASKAWTRVDYAGDGPGPRARASAVLGDSEDTVYFFGGTATENGPAIGRMRQLDITTMTWSQSPIDGGIGPEARTDHLMWMSPTQDVIKVFGGRAGAKIHSDWWMYSHDQERWTRSDKSGGPSGRWGARGCKDSKNDFYMFGGSYEDPKQCHNDLWKNGPLTARNIFQIIDFKLDTATLAALLGATMSTILVFITFVALLCICVRKCRKRRRVTDIGTYRATTPLQDEKL
jgi:hypothetical protein